MKTLFIHLNRNNNGINHSAAAAAVATQKFYANDAYERGRDHGTGANNRNAAIDQVECERDACEEELYRLRYGMERLLGAQASRAGKEQDASEGKRSFRTGRTRTVQVDGRNRKVNLFQQGSTRSL